MLNVRLSEADARVARELKRRGVSASEAVRAALRARIAEARVPDDTDAIIVDMVRRFPRGSSRPAVDTTDRRAVRAFFRTTWRRVNGSRIPLLVQ